MSSNFKTDLRTVLCAMAAVPFALCLASDAEGQVVWDLAADWSDTENSGEPWSYEQGPGTPFAMSIPDWGAGFTDQPAWALVASPAVGHVPAVLKVINMHPNADLPPGTVAIHPTNFPASSTIQTTVNVSWKSPINGVVRVTGAIWRSVLTDRPVSWSLQHVDSNGTVILKVLSAGDLTASSTFNSGNPFDFESGASDPDDLTLSVSADEIIRLEVFKMGGAVPQFTGANLTIADLSRSYVDAVAVPNADGAGTPGVAALGFDPIANRPIVVVKDASGQLVRTIRFFAASGSWTPKAVVFLPDSDGDGVEEIGVLATNPENTTRLRAKDNDASKELTFSVNFPL